MAAEYPGGRRNSSTLLLQELEELSESMYQSHKTTRRTASLALPRSTVPPIPAPDEVSYEKDEISLNPKPRVRRMSLSPWRSRPKVEEQDEQVERGKSSATNKSKWVDEASAGSSEKKKGLWNWKPIRALSHITMQKMSCLFSVEVVTVQNLQPSMNGLRLSVCVRKKETKDGAVQTMPSRVSQGAADFEETLFIRCHVYYTPGSGNIMKFEPRPFLIYVLAVDAEELDFGRSTVDLSGLIRESIEKNFEGTRIRQWDTSFKLLGKAKGGELVLKLGFQIMEKDGGVGIYAEGHKGKGRSSPSVARKQSKTSFSVASPRMTSRAEAWTPSQKEAAPDLQGIDDLNLDEPAPPPSSSAPPPQKLEEPDTKADDNDDLDFEVEDKGVEILDNNGEEEEEEHSSVYSDARSGSSEVVKEVVQDQKYAKRLSELDLIAQQIKALESIMGNDKDVNEDEETGSQALDADEDKVTREFLQLLEDVDELKIENGGMSSAKLGSNGSAVDEDENIFLPDLGKGLGCVVQTRNGGYLAATNPLDTIVARKDTSKLAMQMSKPLILQSNKTGFELFQKMAAIGLQDLASELSSLMPMDELKGKTAEQIAFEGIASAIIQGRNKEGASSSAARTIAVVKSMATAMNSGRKERISTGIWNVSEEPVTIDEVLAFSMQKIESMAVDALKIQAGIAEEDAPFDVSPLDAKTISASGKVYNHLLESAIPIEDLIRENTKITADEGTDSTVTISVIVQLRDPLRQYEAVGGPMIILIHAKAADENHEEERYKVTSMQVGGIRSSGNKSIWDPEKHKLTALQWLVAYGIGKAGKKGKRVASKGPDILWSIASRVMADMWLKPIRNPDVKFTT